MTARRIGDNRDCLQVVGNSGVAVVGENERGSVSGAVTGVGGRIVQWILAQIGSAKIDIRRDARTKPQIEYRSLEIVEGTQRGARRRRIQPPQAAAVACFCADIPAHGVAERTPNRGNWPPPLRPPASARLIALPRTQKSTHSPTASFYQGRLNKWGSDSPRQRLLLNCTSRMSGLWSDPRPTPSAMPWQRTSGESNAWSMRMGGTGTMPLGQVVA